MRPLTNRRLSPCAGGSKGAGTCGSCASPRSTAFVILNHEGSKPSGDGEIDIHVDIRCPAVQCGGARLKGV